MSSSNFRKIAGGWCDFRFDNRLIRRSCFFLFSFFIAVGVSNSAFAYVDPGVGGMLVQLLLGGVAGLVVIMRLYWEKVVNFWRRLCGKASSFEGSDSQRDDEPR